jgi:hypothetical protein
LLVEALLFAVASISFSFSEEYILENLPRNRFSLGTLGISKEIKTNLIKLVQKVAGV